MSLLLTTLAVLAVAREITFPPRAGLQHPLISTTGLGAGIADVDLDLSIPVFAGLTTYANLGYVHCLAGDEQNIEPYDIAILGAPFDTVSMHLDFVYFGSAIKLNEKIYQSQGVTARPGARYGPNGIRQGSRRMTSMDYNIYTGKNVFKQGLKVVDCGDAPLTFLDNTVALKQLDKAHRVISGRKTNSSAHHVPRIITLGGDHTTTLSALRSTYSHWGQVSVIHFDSHLDTWDPEVLGGDVSHYAGVNHGTFLHIAHEEGLIRNSSIHAGIRAPVMNAKYDLANDKACGFHFITARDLDKLGTQGVVDQLKARVSGSKVYISVDIDVLDPAYAPATGTAEVGGWTTREFLTILDGLSGLEVIGADVVEVAPIYDNPGETTVLAAAQVVLSLIQLMADQPVVPIHAV